MIGALKKKLNFLTRFFLQPAQVRERGRWRPTFDIDCKRALEAGREAEEEAAVLSESLHALIDFFRLEYGVTLTSRDFIVLTACIASKISFHLMVAEFFIEGDWAGFKPRLKAARSSDQRLQRGEGGKDGVDLAVYSKTQVFRQKGSCKRGKSNALRALDALGGMEFFPSSSLPPHQHLSTWVTSAHRALVPIRAAPAKPPGRRKGGCKKKKTPKEDSDYTDDTEGPPPDEATVAVVRQALAAAGDNTSEYVADRSSASELYFRTAGQRSCLAVAGDMHVNNNFCVNVDHVTGGLRYACFANHACSGGCCSAAIGFLPMPDGGRWEVKATREYRAILNAEGHPSIPEDAAPEGARCVVLRAPLGCGKSISAGKRVEAFLSANPKGRVLYVCPRVTLLKEALREYYESLDFAFYQDGDTAFAADRVVCSAQSLWRLEGVYDMIVFDEVNKTMGEMQRMQKAAANYKKLVSLLAGAQHVLLLDGYADARARDILTAAGLEGVAFWAQINHATHPRRAVKLLFSDTQEEGDARLVAAVRNGKRVAVPCTNKADAEVAFQALCDAFPDLKGLLLTADTPEDEKTETLRVLKKGDESEQPDFFVYTSVLEVGNSFTSGFFDCGILRVDGYHLSAESLAQMVDRFRSFRDDVLVVCFSGKVPDPAEQRWGFEPLEAGTPPPGQLLPVASQKEAKRYLATSPPPEGGGEHHYQHEAQAYRVYVNGVGNWASKRVDGSHPHTMEVDSVEDAKRRLEAAGIRQETYVLKRARVYRVFKTSLPPPRTFDEVKRFVDTKIALNAARLVEKLRPGGSEWEPESFEDWEARAGTPDALALADLEPVLGSFRDLLVELEVEKANRPHTLVPMLRRLFELQGATVIAEHHLAPPNAKDRAEEDPFVEPRAEKRASKKRGPDTEMPDFEESVRLFRDHKRGRILDSAERLKLDKCWQQYTFGPPEAPDGTVRYKQTGTMFKPAEQRRHRRLCEALPAGEGDTTSLKQRIAHMAIHYSTSMEDTIRGEPVLEAGMLSGLELLETMGLPIDSLTDFSPEPQYEGLPHFTRRSAEILAKMQLGKSSKDQIAAANQCLKDTLGIQVYNANPASKGAFNASKAGAYNMTALRRVGPPLDREDWKHCQEWLAATGPAETELEAQQRRESEEKARAQIQAKGDARRQREAEREAAMQLRVANPRTEEELRALGTMGIRQEREWRDPLRPNVMTVESFRDQHPSFSSLDMPAEGGAKGPVEPAHASRNQQQRRKKKQAKR